jgi:hypothetical protein
MARNTGDLVFPHVYTRFGVLPCRAQVKLGVHRETKEEVALKMVSHESMEHIQTNNKEIAILQACHAPGGSHGQGCRVLTE